MKTLAFILAGALASLAATCANAAADPLSHPPSDRFPLTRTADGKPSFAGVWLGTTLFSDVKTVEGGLPPFQPWAAVQYKKSVDAQEAGAPLLDSTTLCLPHGIPRMVNNPFPFQIMQKPDQVTFFYEVDHVVRPIYMNVPHQKNPGHTYLGDAVGRWEGDTLVVDTVGLNDKTLIDRAGIPHTQALHVVERFSLRSDGRLQDLITVDDPGAFTKPWQMMKTFDYKPKFRLMEYICMENNRNVVKDYQAAH